MSKYERALVIVLRAAGALELLALFPMALMPHESMAFTHAALGLGELPEAPIVGYLTRSASLLYALHGAIFIYVSFDVRRYGSFIGFLAILAILSGIALLCVDIAVGMPLWWILMEAPFYFVFGALMLVLRRCASREVSAP